MQCLVDGRRGDWVDMKAILAIGDVPEKREMMQVIEASGYDVVYCPDRDAFERSLSDGVSLFVFSVQTVGDDFAEICAQYPNASKIAIEDYGWAAAATLVRMGIVDDVVIGKPVPSNLVAALGGLSSRAQSTAGHAYFRWVSASLREPSYPEREIVRETLGDQSDSTKIERAMAMQTIDAQFFRRGPHGHLSGTHFSALLYRLHESGFSGRLQLWRTGLHWILSFEKGLPYCLETRDACDVLSFARWQGDGEGEDPYLRMRRQKKASRELYSAWFRARLLEIFAWPDAEYAFCDGNRPPREPFHASLTHDDIVAMIFDGICRYAPKAVILEVTQSCLSYFFKLKDNASLPDWNRPQVQAVVEKLKKGDTLTEMLATFAVESPVHQVVYLGLIMGQVDWIA